METLKEVQFLAILGRTGSYKTTILISHRTSTVKNCDQIIYLEEGRIVEQGNHNELLSLNDLYADLYENQLYFISYTLVNTVK